MKPHHQATLSLAATLAATAAYVAITARRHLRADRLDEELTALALTQEGVKLSDVERATLRTTGFYRPLIVDPTGEGTALAIFQFAATPDGGHTLTVTGDLR